MTLIDMVFLMLSLNDYSICKVRKCLEDSKTVSPALAGGFFAIGATWEAQSLLCALVKYLVVRCDCLYPRGGNQN